MNDTKIALENANNTNKNPNVVTNQKNNATLNELPKKAVTFFENPFTASLNPLYIRHCIVSLPTKQAIRICFFLKNWAMAISSTLLFHEVDARV